MSDDGGADDMPGSGLGFTGDPRWQVAQFSQSNLVFAASALSLDLPYCSTITPLKIPHQGKPMRHFLGVGMSVDGEHDGIKKGAEMAGGEAGARGVRRRQVVPCQDYRVGRGPRQ